MTRNPEGPGGDQAGTLRRREWLAATLATLAGCGGGVDSGGTGTGADATLAIGTVSGFGSVIVNGVRFDESAAAIGDDDGVARTRSDLRLGMRVEIDASALTTQGGVRNAVASALRLRTEIGGPIESIDAAAQRLVVLGQRVDITAITVVDGGFSALVPGAVVWVSATLDRAGARYVASRIEPRTRVTAYKVRGVIGALDLAAATLDIAGLRVDWSAVAPSEPARTLEPGRLVTVRLAIAPTAGVWRAIALDAGTTAALPDRASAEIEGRVTALASPSSFSVEGIAVDAASAAFVPGTASLALGVKVEIEGRLQGGVLYASTVKLEDDDGDGEAFELHGSIESVSPAQQLFVLRGTTVRWSATTRFDSSSAADLIVGRLAEVRGRLVAGTQVIDATLIHVER